MIFRRVLAPLFTLFILIASASAAAQGPANLTPPSVVFEIKPSGARDARCDRGTCRRRPRS